MHPPADLSLMLVSLIHSVPLLDSRFTSTRTSDSSDLMYTRVHSSSGIFAPLYTNVYTHHYDSDHPHTIINSSRFISLFVESYQLVSIPGTASTRLIARLRTCY